MLEMSERRPTYQNKRPKDEKPSRLVNNPSCHEPPLVVRQLGSMNIDLPGAFDVRADSRFVVSQRNFGTAGRGTRLTPIDKQTPKRNGSK